MEFKFKGKKGTNQQNIFKKIKEKIIQILNFKWKNDPVNPLFKNSKIMKMKDILTFSKFLFEYDQINEDMPFKFDNFFIISENQHPYNTRDRKNNTIIKTLSNSTEICQT